MTRLGIGFSGDLRVQDMISCVKLADKRGFESAWMADHYCFREAITSIAAFAVVTKKIKVATGTINTYTRHPAVIAMALASVDELSNGRAVLGIGAGLRPQKQLGIEVRNPLVALKECIEVVRDLLRGETITYTGKTVNVNSLKLAFKPVRERIPIYLGGIGPRMLQLAGEISDGVILTAGASTTYVKYAIDNLKIGAELVNRDPKEIDVASYVYCSLSEDSRTAKEAMKKFIAPRISHPIFERVISVTGLDVDTVIPVREALQRGNLKKAVAHLTEDMVELFAISGTRKECITKLNSYRSAGLRLPIIVPIGDKAAIGKAIKAFSHMN